MTNSCQLVDVTKMEAGVGLTLGRRQKLSETRVPRRVYRKLPEPQKRLFLERVGARLKFPGYRELETEYGRGASFSCSKIEQRSKYICSRNQLELTSAFAP